MPNFIDKLTLRVQDKSKDLRSTLEKRATKQEKRLQELVTRHWHKLPPEIAITLERRPAFAVDGSIGSRGLANGAHLFIAQALLLGEGIEETVVDVEILPGNARKKSVERFADLMLQHLEIGLAQKQVNEIPPRSVLFLDGALYGQLPQLYPLAIEIEGTRHRYLFPEEIRDAYLYLFQRCKESQIDLISVAKTSREATHSKIWQQAEEIDLDLEISDSEMIYRWTRDEAGYSTPVVLGKHGFVGGSRQLLDGELKEAPAIVSFFVRLADFDDAMRIDLPAFCVGSERRLGDMDGEILDLDHHDLSPILQVLADDYGGLEVYNAPLYAVDREVRLERRRMNDVYLKLVQDILGYEIRLDRSERRF